MTSGEAVPIQQMLGFLLCRTASLSSLVRWTIPTGRAGVAGQVRVPIALDRGAAKKPGLQEARPHANVCTCGFAVVGNVAFILLDVVQLSLR
jgi:hypothetical protein